jgi:hypothetical protein
MGVVDDAETSGTITAEIAEKDFIARDGVE